MADKAILYDASKCIACKGCQVACKQWNELSAGTSEFFASTDGYENPSDLSANTYTRIKFHLTEKTNGDPDWLFRKEQCFHCADADCVTVCPYAGEAMQYDSATGFVWVNRDNCIGCGLCISACPFNIPRLSDAADDPSGEPRSYKCWACLDRVTNGEQPACVKTCAPEAQKFGDRSELIIEANARKAELEAQGKTAYVYGVNEQDGLHYLYILLKEPSFYGLPSADELNAGSRKAALKALCEEAKQLAQKAASF